MPKVVDHQQQRLRIAMATADTISDIGMEKVRLKDIAAKANCTTGTLSYYFASKDELLIAAMDYLSSRFSNNDLANKTLLGDVLAQLPGDDISLNEWRVWISSWSQAIYSPAIMAILQQHRDVDRVSNVDMLKRYQQAGVLLAAVDVSAEAEILRLFVNGLGLSITMDPMHWHQARRRTTVQNYLRRLLAE